MKSAIIVGDYRREDLQFYIDAIASKYTLHLIQLDTSSAISKNQIRPKGNELSITHFNDANHILQALNIYKAFFFALENIHEVLFHVCCKNLGIHTVHLEHGVRDYEVSINLSKSRGEGHKESPFQRLKQKFKKTRNLKERLALKNFFDSSLSQLPKEFQDFVRQYVNVRKSNSFLETCRLIKDDIRLPDSYISFSPKIFQFHKIKDHLDDMNRVSFIGFPYFNNFRDLEQSKQQEFIFIDQPFAEIKMFGWTYDFKFNLVKQIHNLLAAKCGYVFKVKPHPNSNLNFWRECEEMFDYVRIVDESGIKSNDIVIGFASTMLLPLIALEHTVCISLEIHPDIDFNYSGFLTSSEAIKQVGSIEELLSCISQLEELRKEQRNSKSQFISEWMYKYDGNCQKRLLDVI